MTFLKSSCSTVVACEEQRVFQALVNPASAIKNRVSLLLCKRVSLFYLVIKVMKILGFLLVVSEHSALLQLIQVSQDSSEGGTAGIFTDKYSEAQEGTRWASGHVTRRWPTWSLRCGVLTARPVFSAFCSLLPQPPLRLRAKRSCFSSNSSRPSVT